MENSTGVIALQSNCYAISVQSDVLFSHTVTKATPHSVQGNCALGINCYAQSMQYLHPNTTRKATRNYSDTVLANNAGFQTHMKYTGQFFLCKYRRFALTRKISQSKHAAYSHLVSYSSQLSNGFQCGSKEQAWNGWQIDGYGSVNGVRF